MRKCFDVLNDESDCSDFFFCEHSNNIKAWFNSIFKERHSSVKSLSGNLKYLVILFSDPKSTLRLYYSPAKEILTKT